MGIKVLIVDDTVFMRTSLRLLLEKNGFEVVGEADNGLAAINMYMEFMPDVVTMDITMPEMDGLQALKAIRQINANAKVVMVSAMGQENQVRESILFGAKSFIVKPYKDEHVINTLRKIADS
ncbi:response regulator [Ruminiclostridium cellulolyticum]|uniref:Stage 0 sporulation protein A homolog n=1 Tax=Ruminiclostridium cellulolyticum (strain ATCC 35319 / DSM 5812 / JCM 6584 / H10) TaxID=394503 RepID=B8I5B6_RUMCH|nr:response regulator [Ruminiclostridium cellulolyticum]ACL76652.1 response regulator receiver protein [Ruminiclostridium cellulolyticum H10]